MMQFTKATFTKDMLKALGYRTAFPWPMTMSNFGKAVIIDPDGTEHGPMDMRHAARWLRTRHPECFVNFNAKNG